MPRRIRVAPLGVPQHVIQRGNNRQICFSNERDRASYIAWLKQYSEKYLVDVHAWVLMTNHIHLLCTPNQDAGLSQMMQSIGRMYVRRFNQAHGRTGTLWEGRYKACLVDSEPYLLEIYRYIELNPVRANMVSDPSEYKWSSYQCNALGIESSLCKPHELYLKLGVDHVECQANYRALFKTRVSNELISKVRQSTNSGLALGRESFIDKIETLTQTSISKAKMGRPTKGGV